MDIIKNLKNIKTFTQYFKFSEEACKNSNYAKFEFNMSAVLNLKEIRCYEIQVREYYHILSVLYNILYNHKTPFNL